VKRLPLASLAALLITVAAISFLGGLTLGAVRWRARAESASAWVELQARTGRYLDTCIDAHAQCKAVCSEPLAPVDWGRR
jgi:hypothetical protein